MKNGQFPEIIKLGDLNGKNGFKLDGENSGDGSGTAVNPAGDINVDGYPDLIIGAAGYLGGTNKGRSYVVFGGPGVGSNGVIALSGLNGANGFKLDGENDGDESSYSLSTAGDINGDGHADLLIGALGYPGNSRKGRSYVVFGGPGVGSGGVIALSSLNGSDGFKLDGENNGDNSGFSVSTIGDVNSDGIADIAIGAGDHNSGTGRTYVLFGGLTVGSSGLISLGGLDGINGFILDGENVNDESGIALGNPGDVNDDGYVDMLVSAWNYNGGVGRSYVIFGGPKIASSSIISLSSFNGVTGFKLDGETGNVWSGNGLGGNGDVNGDGYQDFLIGAGWYNSQIGRTYVVFGAPGLGSAGTFSLVNINGTNGFKLDGESVNDLAGSKVSIAGDINADGYNDILIGVPYEAGTVGCSYLVFGRSEVYDGGQFSLANVNGFNGIKLVGEISGDFNGAALSAAGDINGDGVADLLIGAYGYNNGVGRSYVVFGDAPPVLINNSLSIFSGGVVSLSASNLAADDRNHDNSTLVFIPTNMTHGQFELIDKPGVILNNFTQQQIWDRHVQFVHDGSTEMPTYNITVRSDGIAWTGPISANITFNNFLNLENNQLVINQGQTVVFTSDNLKATHLGDAESDLSFLISDLEHGQFEFLSARNQSILIFQQQNITDGVVRFVHDNSPSVPSYEVAVSNGTLTTSPQSALVDFDPFPILVRNSLTIGPGQTLALTTGNLYTTHNGIADPNLMFIITDVQNGFFNITNNPINQIDNSENITFSQQQVVDKAVLLSQQGPGLSLPAYRVAISDGRITTSPASATITLRQGQFPEVIKLADLNGQTGFKIDGEAAGDSSAHEVSAAGDVNGDGCADLLIGAAGSYYGGPTPLGPGRSYVVFGKPTTGNSLLRLSTLDGNNGFKLIGEAVGDWSGFSVSAAGDINGDGHADLLIGASLYNDGAGCSYVVFGGPGIGKSGLISLSSLNGLNGFKLNGETNKDWSGVSVSGTGDINGDGYPDLLIGADGQNSNMGRSYVVFGGPGVATNGLLPLSSLNGANGFKLNGETAGDHTGISVSFAGDINSDGYEDLVIGANQWSSGTGRSYVVFGSSGVGNSGVLALSNLNGGNGFKVDGETIFDYSGTCVSAAGDVNNDGYVDLLIGAYGYSNSGYSGRSYVIFGGPGVGSNGLFSLSSLNGINGFKLNSEGKNWVGNGFSVSGIGDINGDGVDDFYTGSPSYITSEGGRGRGYVVFGGHQIGNGLSLFPLSDLNGLNGFKLDGEITNAADCWWGGAWGSGGGDINHDGVDDLLMGSCLYNNSAGRTYVVFGDIPPTLMDNSLSIFSGETVSLSVSNLAACDRNHDNSTLVFIPTNITHGQFESVDNPGVMLNNFTQQQIWDNQIQFVHDGSSEAPAYNITVRSDGIAWTGPISANVILLVHNQLTIGEGQSITFTSENLLATHNGAPESNLTFQVTNIQNGGFILLFDHEQQLNGDVSFQQQQVTNGQISFTSQNSAVPAYRVSVTDGRMSTNPQYSNITFFWKPILTHNQFLSNRGQVTVLTTDNIAATRNGTLAKDLQFVVAGTVQHGRFEQRSNPGNAIISFYQQDILQQIIQFAHDNSTGAPQYSLKVLDNQSGLSSDAQTGKTVVVLNNYFPVNQGENLLINGSILNATGIQPQNDGNIVFTPIVGTMQHGHFALSSAPDYPLTSFQQQQISVHEILFVPDNSPTAPNGYLTVSDSQTNGAQGTMACNIDFDVPPVLKKAYLKTSLGEQIKITDINLKATSPTSVANNLIFEISEISHGYFADNDDWQIPLNNFTQQRITDGNMIFITDQSDQSPQFKVSVWDGRLHCVGCPQQADVVFQGENTSSSSLSDAIKNTVITAAVSGIIGLLFFALRYKHSLSLQRNARPTIDGEEKETYPDTLLLPIAREIFSRIKITGCLGYIGKRDYNEYIGAVSTIVAALETKEVIQPNQWNSLPRPRKQRIIDAIAMHTKELVGNNRCCSTRTFTSFYRAEATPRMIRDQAETIADAVQETLSNRTETKGSRSRSSVRLTLTSAASSLNESQMKTPLLS